MKLYDEEGNEVEAFTQKEVDAKIKEADTESATKLKAAEDSLKEKTTEYDDLSKKYEDKKNSYTEIQKKAKEDAKKYEDRAKADTDAYNKTVDDKIKDIAGDDKEYAEALKKSLEREGVGFETQDPAEIEKQFKEATALTNVELSREVKAPMGDGGQAPASPDGSAPNFTETQEGKDTYEALSGIMGLPEDKEE
jgi:hypothetical protein